MFSSDTSEELNKLKIDITRMPSDSGFKLTNFSSNFLVTCPQINLVTINYFTIWISDGIVGWMIFHYWIILRFLGQKEGEWILNDMGLLFTWPVVQSTSNLYSHLKTPSLKKNRSRSNIWLTSFGRVGENCTWENFKNVRNGQEIQKLWRSETWLCWPINYFPVTSGRLEE